MTGNVKKDTSVCRLGLDGTINPCIINYLLYKYPQVTSVDIAGPDTDMVSMDLRSLSLIDDIQDLTYSHINKWEVNTMQTLKTLISMTNNQRNILHMYRDSLVTFASFSAKKFTSIGITDEQPPRVLDEIISLVSFLNSLDISYGAHEAWKENGQLSPFCQALKAAAQHIEKSNRSQGVSNDGIADDYNVAGSSDSLFHSQGWHPISRERSISGRIHTHRKPMAKDCH